MGNVPSLTLSPVVRLGEQLIQLLQCFIQCSDALPLPPPHPVMSDTPDESILSVHDRDALILDAFKCF